MTLEGLKKLEEKFDLPMKIEELVPFLILCSGWREKDPEFILNTLNAMAGDHSWELLNEEERFKMYDYVCTFGIEEDERFLSLGEWVVEAKQGVSGAEI